MTGKLFTERQIDRLALVADILIVALLIGSFVLFATGGFRMRIADVRLSVRSPERLLLGAMLLALARRFFGPRRHIREAFRDAATAPLRSGEASLFAPAGNRRTARALLELAIIAIFCASLTAAVTWPQIARTDHVPDLGDPLFNVWRVSWVAHQLPRDPLHLFDANIFHPEPRTLTYSDATLVSGFIAAPMIWSGVHPLTAYTLTFLAGFVLSGIAMFYLVRALTGSRPAGMVGAALFALYPYRFEHYSHLELQMIMALPLALWGLHRTFASGRLRDGLLTGVLFAIQIYSSLYYALFSVLYVGAVASCLWAAGRRRRKATMALAAGAALAGALAAPLLVAYIRSRAIVGTRPYDAVQFYSAEGRDYLVPNSRSLLYRDYKARLGYAHPERELFPGVLPVALAAAGAWPPLSIATIAYVTGLAAAFDGSLGANGALYPWLYRYVPAFKGLRVPSRFSILVGISLTVLAGYGAARLTARRRPAAAWTIAGLLIVAVALEARPRLELERVWRSPPPIYDAIGGDAPAVLLEWPLPDRVENFYFDTRYEYFSVFHWNRLVNGNSGFTPLSYFELVARMRQFPSDETLAYLRGRGVQYIAIHGRLAQQDVFARVAASLDARSDLRLVRSVLWEGSESRLYRLEPREVVE